MAKNNESKFTDVFKAFVESSGGGFVKLSDRFSRGILDSLVALGRVTWVELKYDYGAGDYDVRTWKQLKMSGVQDHNVRFFYGIVPRGACTIIGTCLEDMSVWVPVVPRREGPGFENYRVVARGPDEVRRWLST